MIKKNSIFTFVLCAISSAALAIYTENFKPKENKLFI